MIRLKVYSPSDVASLLDIKTATLRKYSIMLEKRGYNIERNSRNHRYYLDKDIITLRNVISGSKNGVTLEESINRVISLTPHSGETNEINNAVEPNNNDIQEIKEILLKQNQAMKESMLELISRSDQQLQRIEHLESKLEKTNQKMIPSDEQGSFLSRLFSKKQKKK